MRNSSLTHGPARIAQAPGLCSKPVEQSPSTSHKIFKSTLMSPSSEPVKRTSPAKTAHSMSSECLSQSAATAEIWSRCVWFSDPFYLACFWEVSLSQQVWFLGGKAKLWFLQLYQSKVVEGHLVRHLDFNQWWIVKKPRTRKVDTGFEGSWSIWPGFVCRQDICTEEGGIGKQPTWAFPQNLLRLQFSSMSRAFQAPFFLYLGWDCIQRQFLS